MKKQGILTSLLLIAIASITVSAAITPDAEGKRPIKLIWDIIMDHEDRISVLEEKTTPIKFSDTNTVSPVMGKQVSSGIQLVSFNDVSFDDPDCTENIVDLQPFSNDLIQLGWCPPSQPQRFILESDLVTSDSVISVSVTDVLDNRIVNCWTGGGKNFTLGDPDTAEIRDIEGFQVECNKPIDQGMEIQATIINP